MSEFQDPLEGTGFQDGPSAIWVSIKLIKNQDGSEACQMVPGKTATPVDSFVGQLLSAKTATWKDPSGKIPGHHEYVFTARAKDKTGEVKMFNFTLSSHWKSPILSDILNPLLWLAAEMAAGRHNGLFKINTYARKTKADMYVMRAAVYDPNNPGSTGFMPGKFPWEGTKGDGKFVGVPDPATDANGVKDFSTIAKFWHNEWANLVTLLSGNTQQAPANKPAAAPTVEAAFDGNAGPSKVVSDAMAWFKKQWDAAADKNETAFLSLTASLFKMCKDPARKTPVNLLELGELSDALNVFAQASFMKFPAGQIIGSDGTLVQDPNSGFQSPAAPFGGTVDPDALPF